MLFRLLSICFFASGATALVYEVLWVRMLALTFGNTVYAIGVVLSAFMSGLTLGSWLIGRKADGWRNLLRVYAALEFGIALTAALSPLILDAVTRMYLARHGAETNMFALSAIRYALSATVLLLPTTLMGGTLPVLSRLLIRSDDQLEPCLGALYSLNTLGGMAGTFLAGFILIKTFGMSATIHATAGVNVLLGLFTLGLSLMGVRGVAESEPTGGAHPVSPTHDVPRARGYAFALWAFFLSGMAMLTYEVAWSRLLIGVTGSTTYAFSLILMGFLLGIALGSWAVGLISARRRLGLRHFSWLQLMIGLTGLMTVLLYQYLPGLMLMGLESSGESYPLMLGMKFALIVLYILLPTTFSGATFPVIAGVYNRGEGTRGRDVGSIYAVNTAGAIAGSALASFVLLPLIGSEGSIKAAAMINVMLGVGGLYIACGRRQALMAAPLLVLPLLPMGIPGDALDTGVAYYKGLDTGYRRYLYQREGLNATIAATSTVDSPNIMLRTNGKVDASLGPDMGTQLSLAYYPLLLHPGAERVLVIGLGSGVSLKAASEFADVRELECVEIEEAVVEAADLFAPVNGMIHRDPGRVKMVVDDARSYLAASRGGYDVIISEPSNPWISGIGNLYSRDYYMMARERLNEGGIYVQWLQLYRLRVEDLEMVLATFASAFPDVTLWQSHFSDIMLIGSRDGSLRLDYEVARRKLHGEAADHMNAYLGVRDPLDVYSYYIMGPRGVAELIEGARINTDDLPLLEFNAPYAMFADHEEAMHMRFLELFEPAPIENADGQVRGNVIAESYFRKARNYARQGFLYDVSWIETALMWDGRNPDYLTQKAAQMIEAGEYEEARAVIAGVLETDPGHHDARMLMGRLMERLEEAGALQQYLMATDAPGGGFDARYEAARLMLEGGDYAGAIGLYQEALGYPLMEVRRAEIHYRMGLAHEGLGAFEEALGEYELALTPNPYYLVASGGRARALEGMGRTGEACGAYGFVVRETPPGQDAIKYLGGFDGSVCAGAGGLN